MRKNDEDKARGGGRWSTAEDRQSTVALNCAFQFQRLILPAWNAQYPRRPLPRQIRQGSVVALRRAFEFTSFVSYRAASSREVSTEATHYGMHKYLMIVLAAIITQGYWEQLWMK